MRISDWSSDVCSSDLADVVAAGGRHDDRIGARRLDLAKHGGALEAPHVGAGDERGGDRGVIGGGGGVDLLHRGGELFGGEAGRKAGLADEEGGARQFHVAGRGGENNAIGGDELDLAEDRLAVAAAP